MSSNKPRTRATSARLAALQVGAAVRERNAYTQEIIPKIIDNLDLSPSDRAFAARLSLGVTSSVGTLDEVIDRCLRSPKDVKPEVRDALRISIYEILFLEKGAHAAVDQGVELAKSVTPKVTGLANVTLRKAIELKKDFPFGNVETDLSALARLHAFPVWLATRLVEEMGRERAIAFMKASNEPAPLFIAVNAIKSSDVKVVEAFRECGAAITPVSVPGFNLGGCFRVADPRVLNENSIKELFSKGEMLVSDASSQAIASLMTPDNASNTFLEIGTGRGTKTILIQSNAFKRFESQLSIGLMDTHGFKLDIAKKRLKTYGVECKRSYILDARNMVKELQGTTFDTIFIDAPCSGLGTLRRHPEIRWKLQPVEVSNLAQQGLEMLLNAAQCVSEKGVIGYSTCTVFQEENALVIKKFLASEVGSQFSLLPIGERTSFSTALSPGSSDAHFAVRMVRKS